MIKYTFFLVSLFSIFISCDNDDSNTQEPEEANFYGLKVGNTYTYKYYTRQGNTDVFEEQSANETIVVEGTTEINGFEYFQLKATTTNSESGGGYIPTNGVKNTFVRDSLGYLVNDEGTILFSNTATEPYLVSENDWGDIYGELVDGQTDINVEGTDYTVYSNILYAILQDGEQSLGKNTTYISENIGLVFETCSGASNPLHTWEKRLISFQKAE